MPAVRCYIISYKVSKINTFDKNVGTYLPNVWASSLCYHRKKDMMKEMM